MLNLKSEYQRTTYNYDTANVEPDGEPVTVTIIDTILIDSDPCFIAVTGDGKYICDSIHHFSGCSRGWLEFSEKATELHSFGR